MRGFRRVAGCVVLLAMAALAAANSDCADDWIRILSARNLQPWPATLTLRVLGHVTHADPARERTVMLAGGATVEITRVSGVAADAEPRYVWDWTPGSLAVRHHDAYLYRPPYAAGESYRILQGFGSRFSHTGRERYAVDFDMPVGTPVHAAREGVVVMVEDRHDRGCWESECSAYANFVVVLHRDGSTGEYYHLQQHGALVRPGERVVRGQLIARSGNTGHTTMPHLHFAVYRAAEWGRTQSLPFRFAARRGTVDPPRHGMRLVAGD